MVASVNAKSMMPVPAWHKPPTFTELDSNRDGVLSIAEIERAESGFSGAPSNGTPNLFKRIDKNGDGIVSKAEFVVLQVSISPPEQAVALSGQGSGTAKAAAAHWVSEQYGAASALGQDTAAHAIALVV